MKNTETLLCAVWLALAFCPPAHAGKTTVIPCTKATDGSIGFEPEELLDRARQVAIESSRFPTIGQFRKSLVVAESGDSKGTCIIEFVSEEQFDRDLKKASPARGFLMRPQRPFRLEKLEFVDGA